jgi:hypothetical protein
MHLVHEGIYYLGVSTAGLIGGSLVTAIMLTAPVALIGLAMFSTGLGMKICQNKKS